MRAWAGGVGGEGGDGRKAAMRMRRRDFIGYSVAQRRRGRLRQGDRLILIVWLAPAKADVGNVIWRVAAASKAAQMQR